MADGSDRSNIVCTVVPTEDTVWTVVPPSDTAWTEVPKDDTVWHMECPVIVNPETPNGDTNET